MNRRAFAAVVLLLVCISLSTAAQTAKVASPTPLTRSQILALLAGDVPSSRVAMLVQARGIDFAPNDVFVGQVQKAGGEDDLVKALQAAPVPNAAAAPPTPSAPSSPPDATTPSPQAKPVAGTKQNDAKLEEAKQEELAQHAAQGAAFLQDRRYVKAEAEYRAAIQLDPQNSYLHMALSRTLNFQKKTAEALQEAHLAIQLNPESDMAHFSLANALRLQENYAGANAEYREALRLNPNFDMAHNNLGLTIEKQGNPDAAIIEFRLALHLNPGNQAAAVNLGNALETKGDLDGAIAQFQQLVHERPRLALAHFRLGQLLAKKGEPRKAQNQFRQAADLAPENKTFQDAYEHSKTN